MNDIGKFIGFLAAVGFALATIGTLKEVTFALGKQAAKDTKRGIFSLSTYNQKLIDRSQK